MNNNFNKIANLNNHLPFYQVTDKKFIEYGRILTAFDFSQALDYLAKKTPIPESGNIYIANDEELFRQKTFAEVAGTLFGGMAIQVGYCNGNGSLLNGLEYHKTIEVFVAQSDLVLQLAQYQQMENFTLDTKHIVAFYLPAKTAIELKPTTLHFAPNRVNQAGFKSLIVLPKGVNTDLEADNLCNKADSEAKLLFKKGKWLLAHSENQNVIKNGAFAGLIGKNLEIFFN